MANITNMKNPSCLLYGPFDARFEDRDIPEIIDQNDVIIRIAYTGVCGSDVHFWLEGGVIHKVSEEKPLTMGHEASGTVHAVGNLVKSLSPGDRVAIEPGYPCRRCEVCKAGTYHLCSSMIFAADPPHSHGTLTRYFRMPSDYCYKIPHSMSLQDAVLMEPLAVGVHAVRQGRVGPGDRVVVFGAGTVGLFCAAVAREFGASVVVSVDLLQGKLDVAQNLAGSRALLVSRDSTQQETVTEIHRLLDLEETEGEGGGGGGADVVIDATGAAASTHAGIGALRRGGTYVQAGMGRDEITFPIKAVCVKELDVRGCFRYGAGDFRMAMGLVRQGKVDLEGIVTKVLPFDRATEAWEVTRRGEGLKTVIECFP